MVQTLDSSDKLKVVQYPCFTLLAAHWKWGNFRSKQCKLMIRSEGMAWMIREGKGAKGQGKSQGILRADEEQFRN